MDQFDQQNTGNVNNTTGAEGTNKGIADMARNLASQAQQKAGEQVRSTVDRGRTRVADTLHDVARTLTQPGTAEGTGGEAQMAQQYMHRAGEQIQRAADYLQNADMRQLVSRTEAFARRQPAVFLGGAFALGVIAARFLKSTPESETGSYRSDGTLIDRERSLASFDESDRVTGNRTNAGGLGYQTGSDYGTSSASGVNNPSGVPTTRDTIGDL